MQLFPQSEDLLLINKRQLQQFSLIIIFMGKINSCLVYGQMMELANRVVLETTVLVTCGFKSRSAHHKAFSAKQGIASLAM